MYATQDDAREFIADEAIRISAYANLCVERQVEFLDWAVDNYDQFLDAHSTDPLDVRDMYAAWRVAWVMEIIRDVAGTVVPDVRSVQAVF